MGAKWIIREITMAFKVAQEKLEGEKYITSSLVVPIIKGIRTTSAQFFSISVFFDVNIYIYIYVYLHISLYIHRYIYVYSYVCT